MSAPSTFTNSPHDGRTDVDEPTVDFLPVLTDWAERTPTREGPFAARFVGTCAACASKIVPGDPVAYGIDNQLEHVSCPDDLTVGAKGTCGDCWTELPLAGVCGVC